MSSVAQHKLTNGNVGFVADAEQEHSAAPRAAAVDARHSSMRGSSSRSQRGEPEARQAVEAPVLTNPLEVRRDRNHSASASHQSSATVQRFIAAGSRPSSKGKPLHWTSSCMKMKIAAATGA